MHYTASLVQRIAGSLHAELEGLNLKEAFGSGRDELFLHFEGDGKQVAIRLVWAARSCFLFVSHELQQKPVPHRMLFTGLTGMRVTNVLAHRHNRSLAILLEGATLVLKLYDGLSNVLAYRDGEFVSHFRTAIAADEGFPVDSFDRDEPYSGTADGPSIGEPLFEQLNRMNREALSVSSLEELRSTLLKKNQAALKSAGAAMSKMKNALGQSANGPTHSEIGDVLMANLHAVNKGTEEVELFDFYRNAPLKIKLKKDLNAQENAALYYRKGKNAAAQKAELETRARALEQRIAELTARGGAIRNAADFRTLRSLEPGNAKARSEEAPRFREFECDGFTVWAGKTSANNDLLTMKHSHKEDLWMHAKDASGSHVVVKRKPGKPFTPKAISQAASIAAYYSRIRGSGLVPVTYTLRKFVRKPKGAEPGMVLVEREEVILVEPGLPEGQSAN